VDQLGRHAGAVSIDGFDRPFSVAWDFRKLRKPEETAFGDIGVLVNLTTWAGENLEGVGLLEAKRRDLNKSSFSSTKQSQLARIAKNAPSAKLLLYDFDSVTSCMDNCYPQLSENYRDRFFRASNFTHSVCVPARTALRIARYTTDLHKFGVPLSYQLIERYFRGFDLEMDPVILSNVKRNIRRHGAPRILMLVGVSTGSAAPVLPEVANDRYVRLDSV